MIKVNQTPVRTSRNFKINNIELKDFKLPKKIGSFNNIKITGDIDNINFNNKLTYGLGKELEEQVRTSSNAKVGFLIDEFETIEKSVYFKFNKDNLNLVDNISIYAKEGSNGLVTIKYDSTKNINAYHNGIIRVKADKDAKLRVIVINLLNDMSYNFLSFENELQENAQVIYTFIDLGGNKSITNYYSNLIGDRSDSQINTIYLGIDDKRYDINYIAHLRGKKCNANIEVQGALKDVSKKNFKGTIDFKTGCVKAKGNENESCMLLSDSAKSLALPMLLCSEEDVEGAHSTSAGKIGNKELFYIMSRGFDLKEAEKLLVRAKFNSILENIEDEELRNQIIEEIDRKLD